MSCKFDSKKNLLLGQFCITHRWPWFESQTTYEIILKVWQTEQRCSPLRSFKWDTVAMTPNLKGHQKYIKVRSFLVCIFKFFKFDMPEVALVQQIAWQDSWLNGFGPSVRLSAPSPVSHSFEMVAHFTKITSISCTNHYIQPWQKR